MTQAPATAHEATLCIRSDHPALAGHFPGRPIVPGVLLLDCVLSEAERWSGRVLPVRALTQAKFTSPLQPEQSAQISLTMLDSELRFHVTRDGATVAQGMFLLASGPGA
jgi:3-hydroxyacyl-[acyl-carrier-protein] dehydratase